MTSSSSIVTVWRYTHVHTHYLHTCVVDFTASVLATCAASAVSVTARRFGTVKGRDCRGAYAHIFCCCSSIAFKRILQFIVRVTFGGWGELFVISKAGAHLLRAETLKRKVVQEYAFFSLQQLVKAPVSTCGHD